MTLKRQNVARLTERWNTAGLPPGTLSELLEATAAAEAQVRAAHRTALDQAEAQVRAAATKVVADPASFAAHAAETAAAQNLTEPARDLMTRSVATIYTHATQKLRALWADTDPAIIAAHDTLMTDLAKLAPKLDGIPDDQAAVKAGTATAAAWTKANEITERRAALIALREEAADVLGLDGFDRDDDLRQYRHPERLRSWHPKARDAPHHPVTILLDDLDAGAEPALCTDTEVAATLERTGGDRRPVKVHPFAADRVRSQRLLASLGAPET